MARLVITKSGFLFLLLFTVMISVGSANSKDDPFASYKDFIKKPFNIEPKDLKHYQEEERMIRDKLKLDLSKRERVILAGLHWLITYMDKDDRFEFAFPDFMLLMNSLKNSENRIHQKEVVTNIIRKSLARELKNLRHLDIDDDNSRFELIRMINIAYPYKDLHQRYLDFYSTHYGNKAKEPYKSLDGDFLQALKKNNHKSIFGHLLQTSFLHHYLNKMSGVSDGLPKDKFPEYLREFESYNYNKDLPVGNELRDLGYLATHIPLYLTNYGEFLLQGSVLARKAGEFLDATLDKVRYQLGDFDLLAEYVLCLKMLNPKGDSRIKELEQFLFDLQRPDGSWGSSRDFDENPYTAIHPGGAALMAINSSNGGE